MYTIMNIRSSSDVRGAPVRNCLMFSNSLTLAIVSPTFLVSKYLNGRLNRCLNSLAPSITSILDVVWVNT